MQRINLFPDPNMANTIFQCIPAQCTVDFPTVSGFRWLRATTSGSGGYAQYQLTGANLPPAGVYHIHAVCYAQGSGALFRVYAGDGNRYTILNETGIADNQTKGIDADITIPANTTQLLIRVVPPSTVGKFILIRDILLESKSTYDTGVGGGASGLLHGRHDATSVGATIGLVMSDDGHEYRQQSERHDHFGSKRVEDDNQRPEQARHDIRRQRLSARQWRFHQGGLQRARNNQLRSTRHLSDANDRRKPDGYVVQRRVRQSDCHSDEYAHLHVGRIPGEQGLDRRPSLVRRGYDAARLTLLGVMA